jgi:dethiobiotin synthetase
MKGWFVTGTDTGVGKTLVAAGLMRALRARGLSVAGMKPVASGCEAHAKRLQNADALILQAEASIETAYEAVNPYAFAPPVAPHIAARERGVRIELAHIVAAAQRLARRVDFMVIEGVGGWLVPLSEDSTLADLAVQLRLPVVLVVGMRLGCLNHALLTAEAMRARNCAPAGWVASCIDPDFPRLEENIETLRARIHTPLLGVVPHLSRPDTATVASCLDPSPLLD